MIDLSCHEVRRHLEELLDGELGGWKRLLALRHLGICAGCAQQQRRLARLAVLLREAPAFAAPPDFLDGVNARLAGPPRPPPPRRLVCSRWREFAAAVAVLLAGLLGTFTGVFPARTETPPQESVGSDRVVEAPPLAPIVSPLESRVGPEAAAATEPPLPLDDRPISLEQPVTQPEAAPADAPATPASTAPAAGASMEQV
jgi:predicted anti-sigma-YlaC factor YlaD